MEDWCLQVDGELVRRVRNFVGSMVSLDGSSKFACGMVQASKCCVGNESLF